MKLNYQNQTVIEMVDVDALPPSSVGESLESSREATPNAADLPVAAAHEDGGSEASEQVNNHPRAKELKRRILERRKAREESLGIFDGENANKTKEKGGDKDDADDKYMSFLSKRKKVKKKGVSQKVLDTEKKAHGRMMLTLANYNHENRNFLGRMEQQYSVSKTLQTLAKDISEFSWCRRKPQPQP